MTSRDGALFILLGALWGASFLFMRVAAPELGPLPLVAMRVAIGAIVLVGMLAARGELSALRGRALALFVVGATNSAVPFALFAYATLSLPAGYTSVLNATAPLLGAALGAAIFRDPLGLRRFLGLLVGFAGVLVLVKRAPGPAGSGHAIAAGLLASLLYAVAAHYSKRTLGGVPPLAIAAGSMVGAASLLAGPAFLLWPRGVISPRAWAAAVVLGALCTGLAYVIYFRLIDRLGAVKAMAVAYLIPVFGIIWGALFLRERVTGAMAMGAATILAGTYLVTAPRAAERSR